MAMGSREGWHTVASLLEENARLRAEVSRLRADGATLKVRADEAHAAHSASFGALSTLSDALFDGEVDDYAALADKIIARVRQLESDGATLRERVDELVNAATALLEQLADKQCTGAAANLYALCLEAVEASAPKEP